LVPSDDHDSGELTAARPTRVGNEPIEVISPDQDYGEGALLLRLRAKDARAYEQVIRDLSPRLIATAARMLGNEEDARDAVQDAFLSAFRNVQNFDGKSKLSTWLHRITINASLMKLRTKRRKPAVSIEDLLPRHREDGHFEVPIASWREKPMAEYDLDMRHRVREEIENLPDEYRTVIMLRDVEGLDTAEAGVVLGISESAVKTRLHRARQALRERLAPMFAGASEGDDDDRGPAKGGRP
jgi:RNA polymerase sigma-70 factor (ECF subfamily)